VPIFAAPQPASPYLGYRAPLLSGDDGIAQTIALMRHLVDEAQGDANFVRKAIDIVRNVPAFDDFGEARAIFNWVRSNIRFTKDPISKEKLYPPQELLKIRAGDCDDISMLVAALGMAIGYNARLITIGTPQSGSEFSHVYAELEVPAGTGNWLPMDAARVDSEFGIAPPVYTRKRAWSLSDDGHQDLSGIRRNGWVSYDEIVTDRPGPGRYTILLRKRPGEGLSGCSGCGMGQDDPSTQATYGLLSQALTEVPTIIAASSGEGSSVTSPYGSFQTQYSPSYGVPSAGYQAPQYIQPSPAPSVLPWLIAAVAAVALLGGKHR
jgi:hypothetical protein